MQKNTSSSSHRLLLLIAGVIVVALYQFIPYGRYLLYPVMILSTWVHEMGHGIAAIVSGGIFKNLHLFSDGSGVAYTIVLSKWQVSLVAAGGLLAPPIVGAFLLIFARFVPRMTLWVFVGVIALGSVIWLDKASSSSFLILLTWLVLVGLAVVGTRSLQRFAVQFVAVVLATDTVTRGVSYLFSTNAQVDGSSHPSDIIHVAQALPGPYQLWAAVLASMSLLILLAGLWFSLRSPKRFAKIS